MIVIIIIYLFFWSLSIYDEMYKLNCIIIKPNLLCSIKSYRCIFVS